MKTYCNFILKFTLCTTDLCLLCVYTENEIKIINLKKKSNRLKQTRKSSSLRKSAFTEKWPNSNIVALLHH